MSTERPRFVMGARKIEDNTLSFPITAELPHASLHPGLFKQFHKAWITCAEKMPKANAEAKLSAKFLK